MSKTTSPGICPLKKHSFTVRAHAERRGVDHGVEMPRRRAVRAPSPRRRKSWRARARGRHCGPPARSWRRRRRARMPRRAPPRRCPRSAPWISAGAARFDSGPVTPAASVLAPRHLPALRQTVFTAPMRLRQRIHHIQIADDLLLVRNGDAESGDRQRVGQRKEIAQLRRRHQERQIDRIDPPRLKGAVVHGGRNGMPHRVGDHAVDLGGVGRAYRRDRGGAASARSPARRRCPARAWARRKYRRRRRRARARAWESPARPWPARPALRARTVLAAASTRALSDGLRAVVTILYDIGREFASCDSRRVERRRGFEIVIRDDHVRAPAELVQLVARPPRRFRSRYRWRARRSEWRDRACAVALRCCR